MSKRRALSLGFKIFESVKLCFSERCCSKKSLLSFHTIDGNHSFTIISVHPFFFKNTISEYCGWDEAVGFIHTDQLFGQAND